MEKIRSIRGKNPVSSQRPRPGAPPSARRQRAHARPPRRRRQGRPCRPFRCRRPGSVRSRGGASWRPGGAPALALEMSLPRFVGRPSPGASGAAVPSCSRALPAPPGCLWLAVMGRWVGGGGSWASSRGALRCGLAGATCRLQSRVAALTGAPALRATPPPLAVPGCSPRRRCSACPELIVGSACPPPGASGLLSWGDGRAAAAAASMGEGSKRRQKGMDRRPCGGAKG